MGLKHVNVAAVLLGAALLVGTASVGVVQAQTDQLVQAGASSDDTPLAFLELLSEWLGVGDGGGSQSLMNEPDCDPPEVIELLGSLDYSGPAC